MYPSYRTARCALAADDRAGLATTLMRAYWAKDTMAMEEISRGKLTFTYPSPGQ